MTITGNRSAVMCLMSCDLMHQMAYGTHSSWLRASRGFTCSCVSAKRILTVLAYHCVHVQYRNVIQAHPLKPQQAPVDAYLRHYTTLQQMPSPLRNCILSDDSGILVEDQEEQLVQDRDVFFIREDSVEAGTRKGKSAAYTTEADSATVLADVTGDYVTEVDDNLPWTLDDLDEIGFEPLDPGQTVDVAPSLSPSAVALGQPTRTSIKRERDEDDENNDIYYDENAYPGVVLNTLSAADVEHNTAANNQSGGGDTESSKVNYDVDRDSHYTDSGPDNPSSSSEGSSTVVDTAYIVSTAINTPSVSSGSIIQNCTNL